MLGNLFGSKKHSDQDQQIDPGQNQQWPPQQAPSQNMPVYDPAAFGQPQMPNQQIRLRGFPAAVSAVYDYQVTF